MQDEEYMQRCFDLAQRGRGNVSPNPMVGCVITVNDAIIGEGFHEKYGGAHAEVNAIQSVFDRCPATAESLLAAATVYVSLEPCAHFGKTPPCADLLIKYHVKRVVIANKDPFPDVNGKGIARLQAAGIEVKAGILEKAGASLNRRFFTQTTKQRPYIILKWAQTADGFFAPVDKVQRWITGDLSRRLVHKWRTEEDAILIGKTTAVVDNPELTARLWSGRNPVRVLIDRNLLTPVESAIFYPNAKTIVLNAHKTETEENVQFIQLEDMNYYLPEKIMYQMYLLDIQSVIIEGGAKLLNQFIDADLWDEARIFTGASLWGAGQNAPNLAKVAFSKTRIGEDELTVYYREI